MLSCPGVNVVLLPTLNNVNKFEHFYVKRKQTHDLKSKPTIK